MRFAEQTFLKSSMKISLTLSVKAYAAAWNVATSYHFRRDGPQPSQVRPDVLDSVEDAVLVQEAGKDLRDRSCSGLIGIGEDHQYRHLS